MLVKEWLEEYLAEFWPEHLGRELPPRGEPERSRIWTTWLGRFIALRASLVEARLASQRLAGQELGDADEWLSAVAIEIDLIRRPAEMPPPPPAQPTPEHWEEAAKAIHDAELMTDEGRREMAQVLLAEFEALGWEMRPHDGKHQFTTHRTRPDAPAVPPCLSAWLRALKPDVYAVLLSRMEAVSP